MKKKSMIILSIILSSCGLFSLPSNKELNKESKKELDKIVKELKLEDLNYSYRSKSVNGKETKYFDVILTDIDDSTNFIIYNNRLIRAFEKSNFEFADVNYIEIFYLKKYIPVDVYVIYTIDPVTKKIVEVSYK